MIGDVSYQPVNPPIPQDAGSEAVAAEQTQEIPVEATPTEATDAGTSPMPQLAGSEEPRDEYSTETVAIPISDFLTDREDAPMPHLAGSGKPPLIDLADPSTWPGVRSGMMNLDDPWIKHQMAIHAKAPPA